MEGLATSDKTELTADSCAHSTCSVPRGKKKTVTGTNIVDGRKAAPLVLVVAYSIAFFVRSNKDDRIRETGEN